ncbi:ribosome biogenesis GTPase Der [Maridesulfovibrio ferrireducens]|uniref:ribosome biogenesis GTPase Der n=1 Tax=Maridesulfovibrio ferrireducens TaxID=246191 RepID=UPI001A239151|nr:ribosome biogenesis GTPase Der [Maridesulfovibrio ferrireducens]MBI9112214.1 ribosome biogenesis GTPase Der [Maridesulfovibrio ferrireducens]
MLPTIALVGRPNVGKSTIFNRLLRKKRALTHDMPGITRDRIYDEGHYEGVRYALVDTGGLVMESDNDSGEFQGDIFDQAREAIEESHALILVVDGRAGLTPLDEQVAAFIRQSNKPIVLLVNKVDGSELEAQCLSEFHGLGFEIMPVSAEHGYNLEALRAKVAQLAEETGIVPEEEDPEKVGLKIAMLGRPNAGKSSMVNALTGEERVIVSDIAGTTRDSVNVTFRSGGKIFTFVDTAGVRRRTNIANTIERYSVLRALKSSKIADVTVMVVDALGGLTKQDKRLLDFLAKEATPFIIAVNKIDLVSQKERDALKEGFERALRMAHHVPVIYTSCISKSGLGGILPLAAKLKAECSIRVSTGQLNRIMKEVIQKHQPPVVKRRRAKFKYLTQADEEPPTFIFFINDERLIRPTYHRFLENKLRKILNIKIAPLNIYFRSTARDKETR